MPDLSLQDMLKIMDVAREMRQDRELVLEELSHEERVSRLQERLLASTSSSGMPAGHWSAANFAECESAMCKILKS